MSGLKFAEKLFNLTNTTDEYTIQEIKSGVTSFYCNTVEERIPKFDKAPCETKISGKNNSFIILGRDRNASLASGNGGRGRLQCGMIDLVAGRGQLIMAHNKKKNRDPLDGLASEEGTAGIDDSENVAGLGVGPMFHSDAARIYISQKCDVDRYFGLKPSGGPTDLDKSAVAMKADQLRIIGREKVRIYAGRGNFAGFDAIIGETNSLGDRLEGQVIELQVGNQELHPMVLGRKLVRYLKRKNKKEKKMYQLLFNIHMNLLTLNSVVSCLPGAAVGIIPMMQQIITDSGDTFTNTFNTYLDEIDALENSLIPGANHILSDSVFTT